jgi:hypothetical protein
LELLDLLPAVQVGDFLVVIYGSINAHETEKYLTEWPMAYDLGYDGYNSLRNMGSIPFIMIFAAIQLHLYFLWLLLRKLCQIQLCNHYFKHSSQMGTFLSIFVECYMEFLIVGYFNIGYGNANSLGQAAALIYSVSCLVVCLLILPMAYLYTYCRINNQRANRRLFKNRFEAFISDLKRSKAALCFRGLYMVRRVVLVESLFF